MDKSDNSPRWKYQQAKKETANLHIKRTIKQEKGISLHILQRLPNQTQPQLKGIRQTRDCRKPSYVACIEYELP